MSIQQAYNSWAEIYDSNENKTRDLEKISLQNALSNFNFNRALEVGCGTGKNSEFITSISSFLLGIDFSSEMIAKAKEKLNGKNAEFILADINQEWNFVKDKFDLITFSLVLEHIEDLNSTFKKVSQSLNSGGILYVGELHPFKQYAGSKARYESNGGTEVLTCFIHNVSDFTNAALVNELEILNINEYFDNDDRTSIPRILTIVFKKK